MATLRLANIRNSCYINSSVQLLHSIPKFRNFILEKLYFHASKTGMQQVCESLFEIFSKPHVIQNVEELRSCIRRSFPQHSKYDTNQMWDTEEFLIHLLECIDFEKYGNLYDDCTLGLFKGMLRSTHRFNESHSLWCSNETCTEQEFHIYNLFVSSISKKSLSIQGLLDESMSIKTAGGLKKCYSCNEYEGPYTEQSDLRTYPEYLLIKVYKTDGMGNKLHVFVKSESQIVIDGNAIYDRISIFDHIGNSFNSGHWRVHNKISGRWVTCNDTDISFNRSDLTVQTKDNSVYLYKRLANVSQKPDEYQIIEYGRDVDLAEKENESYKSVQNESKSQKISKEALVSSNVAIQNNSKRKHNTSPESKILHTAKEKEQSEIFEDFKIGLGKHSKRMKPDTSKDNIVIGSNDNIEHTLNISKENTKDDNIEKGSSTKTTRKRKTNGSPQTCEGIADKFSVESILKSIEINPNDSKSNDDLLSEEEDLLCKGCGKKFQRLLAHLKRSSPCGSYHDIDKMTRKANERRKEQK